MMKKIKSKKKPSSKTARAPLKTKFQTAPEESLIRCAFCRGTGFDRFGVPSKLSKCQACQGRGMVYVPEPYEKCPSCLGSGVYRHHRLTCAVCGGKGRVRKLNRDRNVGCEKENNESIEMNTGLPCINAYELGEVDPRN